MTDRPITRHCAALVSAAIAAALLAACATPTPDASQPAPQPTAAAPSAAVARAAPVEEAPVASEALATAPEQRNYTGAPVLLLTGQDQWGEYFSAGLKLTYSYDASGKLTRAAEQEPVIDGNTLESLDTACAAHGAGMNQRTTWFPDTGVFVRGGTLRAIRAPMGANATRTMQLIPLSVAESVYMMATGRDARKLEMAYVPCVGEHRVSVGQRTAQFVPLGATLDITEAAGKRLQLTLPTALTPFVLLRYRSGALIPSPMRIALITVDTQRKRVVLQFQSTAMVKPPIRVIEWRALSDGDQPADGESLERYRERRDTTAADLAKCPVPFHPPEPCASETRQPDRRIFGSR